MPTLMRTTENEGHYHAIYIGEDGMGITSPEGTGKNRHTHTYDPETGELSEADDGHSHFVIDFELEPEKKPEVEGTDDELLKEGYGLYRAAAEGEGRFRQEGRESYKYYLGEQWTSDQKNILIQSKRACITSNFIKTIVNAICGHQRQNRSDIKTFPIENANPLGAEIANVLIKHAMDKCNAAEHENMVGEDQVITGRGCFDMYVTHDDEPEGDIKVVRYKWDDVFLGPHAMKDISDLEYLVKTKWFSRGKLQSKYPDKFDDIGKNFEDYDKSGTPYIEVPANERYTRGMTSNNYDNYNDMKIIDVEKKTVKLMELWRKRYNKKELLFYSDKDLEYHFDFAHRLSKKDLNKAKKIEGINLKYTSSFNMEVIVFAGGVVLEKRVESIKDFTVIPVYMTKIDDIIKGMVDGLIDSQDLLNKFMSQAADIINKSNNYGFYYDSETFDSASEEQMFIDEVNTPGFVIKVKDTNRTPVKEEHGSFPSELINMIEFTLGKMMKIASINPEMVGESSNVRAGVAINKRIRQGLVSNDHIFDNLSIAKKRLGKNLLMMIQETYSVDRVMKILNNQNSEEPFTLKDPESGVDMPYSDFSPEFIEAFLDDVDFTKYDVSISESASSPTKNLDRFETMKEIFQNGGLNPILIDLAKEAGIISPKSADRYQEMLSQQSQAEQQAQNASSQAEIAKTVLAKDRDPNTLQPLPGANQ